MEQGSGSVVRAEAPDCLVIASIVCVVVWATSGGGYFWPIWVLLPTFLPVVLGRGRSWCRTKNQSAAAGVSGHLRRQDRS